MGSLTLVLRSAILASSALHAVGQSLGTGISAPPTTGPYNNFTSHSTDLQTSISSDESSSTPVTLSNDPTTITSSHSQPAFNTSTTVDTASTESSSSGEISTGVTLSSSSSVLSSTSSTSLASETASNTTDVQISSTSNSISSSGIPSSLTSSTSNSESPSTSSSGSSTATITATGSEPSATITSAPSTTIAPSGSQASSSETALHTQLSSVIPIIQSWIDDDTEDIDPIISSLDDIEDETNDLLSEISDDSDKDTDHDCTANLFSLLTCVVDDVVSIKGSITEGVVEGVTGLLEDLTGLTDELENREDDDDDDDESSSTTSSQASTESSITSSTSSSTSSCSSGTSVTEDYFVTCSPTVISSTTTQTCQTSTSTVSGCSVSATASTTTISSSAHPQCAQTGCSACTATTVPKPTAPCADCITTVSDRAYPAEQTTIPSGADEITSLDELANNTSNKRKRTLATPADFNGNYLDFFTAQLQDPSLVNVPHRPAGTGGSSSALVQLYLDYPFSMTVQGLYGCTAVVLISRRGVYMSHLFENPGFTNNFQNDIAQAIPNGDATPISIGSVFDGQPWCPNLRSLSAAGGTFDPNQEDGVKTILVTPGPYISDTTTNIYRYPNEINVIRTWLSNTFGSEPSDHIYTSTDNFMSNNQGVSFGKVLFQYDPNQAIVFEDKIVNDGKTYRCPVKYAGVKLWSGFQQDFLGNDMDPFYEMDWPTQVYDPAGSVPGYQPNGQQKRDEVPEACTLVEDESSSTSSVSSSTATSSSTAATSSGASLSPSPTSATSTPASSSSTFSTAPPTSSSALSTVPYSVPLTLSTVASSTTSGFIATTNIGSWECKYVNRETAPDLGCGIDPFWQCLGASTTLYLPGSATPSGSTIDADQTMAEPTYTGTATGTGACSSTAVSASKTETETETETGTGTSNLRHGYLARPLRAVWLGRRERDLASRRLSFGKVTPHTKTSSLNGRMSPQRLAVLYRRFGDVREHYLWGGESDVFFFDDEFSVE
ncbi:hypothetical protein D0859_06020 [Hortaea werneckii]|uniref:Ig-like domain-containing protein n=1 Tax=Hortaea werneckii TaxID=91943 RepID=A0A3M7IX46_HORWE|nr:hypothetical protein D0859_06020 [Hortaea werneckii]